MAKHLLPFLDRNQVRCRGGRLDDELLQALEHAGLPEDVELHVRLEDVTTWNLELLTVRNHLSVLTVV